MGKTHTNVLLSGKKRKIAVIGDMLELGGMDKEHHWVLGKHLSEKNIDAVIALGAVIKGTYVFALPGSKNACKDAWDEILKFQLDNRYRPCNFIEIIPRLMEV